MSGTLIVLAPAGRPLTAALGVRVAFDLGDAAAFGTLLPTRRARRKIAGVALGWAGAVRRHDSPGPAMKVAVIGSGISGLTAAHVIARRGNEVTLYEKDGRFGGHSNTVTVAGERGEIGVDTGFIVHNRRTYPHLIRLFDELGVATQESDMSFGVRCDDCGLEYAGARGVRGMLATPGSLARPSYLRMLTEVRRFHQHARRVLLDPAAERMSLGDFLDEGGYSDYCRDHFVLPLTGAIWSSLTQPDVRVPRPLPDPLLRKPRHADRAAMRRAGGR